MIQRQAFSSIQKTNFLFIFYFCIADSGPPPLQEDDLIEKMAKELSEIEEEEEGSLQKPWSITK